MPDWNWDSEELSEEYLSWHTAARKDCQRDILQMTHFASSGHPGGSLSSLDLYLVLYSHSNLEAKDPWKRGRDRIVVSHGHTSPGVYSVLCRLGYFSSDEVIASFRRTHNIFEGHIERIVPGVEWTTGNLGQGLSAATGMAMAEKLQKQDLHCFVPMGDGEQQKGQISEARRFAVKFGLNNITALVDYNQLQIGGDIQEIMPQDIAAGYAADGWKVLEIDGHNPVEIHRACRAAVRDNTRPYVIIANTVMGKGFDFMEGLAKYHGSPCSNEEYDKAAAASGDDPELWDRDLWQSKIAAQPKEEHPHFPDLYPSVQAGEPRTYGANDKTDNRSAFGNALADVAVASRNGDATPFAVFDCDLEGSVKTTAFRKEFPDNFIQTGIQEHHAATCAGALSAEPVVSVFADFGVFGIAETFNQHRLTDINHGKLKLICTHIGLDVGEDGRTHQCIDYVGVLRNLYGMRIFVPADPNQTDRAFRYMATNSIMAFLGMGRSKLPTILGEDGQPFFAGDYEFKPGQLDWIRKGSAGAVVAMGTICGRALAAVDELRAQGMDLAMVHAATPAEISKSELDKLAKQPFVLTVEDHNLNTGLGECLSSGLFAAGHQLPLKRMGVSEYAPSGNAESVYAHFGMDTPGLVKNIKEFAQQTS